LLPFTLEGFPTFHHTDDTLQRMEKVFARHIHESPEVHSEGLRLCFCWFITILLVSSNARSDARSLLRNHESMVGRSPATTARRLGDTG
jgi:hypothetical protein